MYKKNYKNSLIIIKQLNSECLTCFFKITSFKLSTFSFPKKPNQLVYQKNQLNNSILIDKFISYVSNYSRSEQKNFSSCSVLLNCEDGKITSSKQLSSNLNKINRKNQFNSINKSFNLNENSNLFNKLNNSINFLKMDKSIELLKPLNILIYVDNEQHNKSKLIGNDYLINLNDPLEEAENKLTKKSNFTNEYCDQLFNNIQSFLTFYLSQNFTIYSITSDELNKGAWLNSTKLLIIVQDDFDTELEYLEQTKCKIVDQFKNDTNNVIILNHKLLTKTTANKQFGNLNIELLKDKIKEKMDAEYVYENFNVPNSTTHYVYSDSSTEKNRLIDYLNKSNIKTESFNNNTTDLDFDIQKYLKHLEPSNTLGRNVIVANVTKSTQPIAENSPIIDGLVVITNQQTEGKGRGKNQWLSPAGSISFTYAVSVPIHSTLFKYLAFYQHINALGILLAIKKFNNMDQLDLKIKWPNDIYYKEKYKLVGILTNSKFEGDCAKFFIGTGINLSNCKPTYSLKNIVENDLKCEFTISKEQIIAEVLNQIDNLIKIINNQGKEEILDLYYKNWMMKNKVIQLSNGKHATVCGLDEDGYLRVNLIDDGEIVSLLPDGNSFDILFGLKEFNN